MNIGRNDLCWCGSGKKYKSCHLMFDDKIKRIHDAGHKVPTHKMLKSAADIQGIKDSAKINIACLDYVAEHIKAGISTQEIDDWVAKITGDMGGVSACLNYEGFPKNCCTSINDEVCHGIPSEDIILHDGDIINVDCSTIYKGYFSDSSRMFIIGETTPEKKKLVEDVHKAVEIGLAEVKPWRFLGDMGSAINEFCKSQGYSVVEEIGGHGCGIEFHEEPWVSFVSKPNTEMLMVPGMCFTIEPMVNLGEHFIYEDEDNGWTIYTEDGSPSAQWEVQLVVTDNGYEILSY
ncbi:MAG: type I methionyl aminopeptidase [Lachnospiraceae bacterium]|nr:type I methionyl aminopeptidase [Lachnospiraceae bacterium]